MWANEGKRKENNNITKGCGKELGRETTRKNLETINEKQRPF